MTRQHFYCTFNLLVLMIAVISAANVSVFRNIRAERLEAWTNSSSSPLSNGLLHNNTMSSTFSSFSTGIISSFHMVISSGSPPSGEIRSSTLSTSTLSLSSSALSQPTSSSTETLSNDITSTQRPQDTISGKISSTITSPSPISSTAQPSHTSEALAAVTAANEAIGVYQKSPTSDNAKAAQDKVNHALDRES